MDPDEFPNVEGLTADLERVESLLRKPFGSFLDEGLLWKLETSKSRSILALVMRRYFVELDGRIRFVEAAPDGNPNATMKLSAVDKAVRTAVGYRLLRLLGGGVVAATVKKEGLAKDWRIVGLKRFMPIGKERVRHEADLEALLRLYLRNPPGKTFPSTSVGAFQIRTGPGNYDVYLKAQDYFTHTR
jgi:hypothetical protein